MSSHLSKTEYEIMEYFWGMGDKYTFGELMKYFNENLDKNWKKQTFNTFLSRLIEKGLLKKEKEGKKTCYQMTTAILFPMIRLGALRFGAAQHREWPA